MLDDDQYAEEQYLFHYEEKPVDNTEGEEDDLNQRNPDEIVDLLPADGTKRRVKHALAGGHPAEEALPGKTLLGGFGHADLLGKRFRSE
ncbi:MAG: hypothetical protein IH921_07660 [Gemmatimonadetes bacterium]|nr:hypothetical protein [Gemmatimonadota bacterium]